MPPPLNQLCKFINTALPNELSQYSTMMPPFRSAMQVIKTAPLILAALLIPTMPPLI
ncbi:17285_t:CDS:2 [Funneliformis caledonium]|uniref:17285_t:CDS:1 n=1 Tax=Funneliformis caledonium TaxID=1117310 RepID=A0A9N9BFF3_9GLOM|nr:17285_t:CDS:2 [Funneliformis caledonium]